MKLPPENDEGTFDCEHHRIPVDGETDILDCVCADDSLLILLQSGSAIKLIQFINQDPSPRFNFINEFIETKYQFIFARIIPETFYSEEDSLEAGVNVYLFFPKCQNIGIYEFHQNPELIGSIEHAEKFNEHIKLTSNRNMLKSNSRDTGSEIFNDNDISKLLKQGYLEQIGSTLLLKQPGTDGYHTNMGDLRDFIEKWSSKFESKINNVIIDSVLKYFNPEKYGSTFETKKSIMNKAEEAEKSIQSLVKLYHYILHRRILEGKEKQINLRADKLNISDISDIKMIEKRCVQIESNVRFLKYMNWFIEHDFFIDYYEKLESLQGKHKERNESKIQHYKRNFDQSIKNFILADSLFIDKIIEETVGSAGAADYRSILRSNKLTDFQYNVNNEDQVPPVALSYPLNGIEDFIILLKSTNIDKIKDYVVLYTLLDLDFPADSTPIIQLVNSLQCEDSLKEIMFYWRLESSYIDESNLQYTIKDVQGLEFIPKEWTPSVLQTLLELKHFSAMRIWQDWSQTSPNSQVVQALDPKMQKTFELMIYSLCESEKYNQAFLSLLEIEERVNPIRYKNIFKLFIGHMISNGKFEHL